jgi:hypothetical protein
VTVVATPATADVGATAAESTTKADHARTGKSTSKRHAISTAHEAPQPGRSQTFTHASGAREDEPPNEDLEDLISPPFYIVVGE